MSFRISANTPNPAKFGFFRKCKNRREHLQSKVFNPIKGFEIKSEKTRKALDWLGKNISSPENRLILGISALMSQPFIDLHNKKIDEDTRKASAARTIAKIIVGTTTGVIIRRECIKFIDTICKTSSKNGKPLKKIEKLLVPNNIKNLNSEGEQFKQYKKIMGTLAATFVMLFTNFLIDLPCTIWLTNKFLDKINAKKAKEAK